MPYIKELYVEAEKIFNSLYGSITFFNDFAVNTGNEVVTELLNSDEHEKKLKVRGVGIRMTEEIRNALDYIARKEGVSISYIIENCLSKTIKEYERWEQEQQDYKLNWLADFMAKSEEEQKLYLEEQKNKYGVISLLSKKFLP